MLGDLNWVFNLYVRERTLYWILSFIFSQWRDLIMGVIWWNLGVLVGDGITSSRIKNKLQTICLSEGEIKWQRVAVVKFAMNKRGSYGTRCGTGNTALYAERFSWVVILFIRVRQWCCVVDAIQLVAAKFYQQSYTLMLASASSTQIPNAPTAVGLDWHYTQPFCQFLADWGK